MFLGNGAADLPTSYMRELTGDSIAEKNPFFCELTGMYYVWKNCDLPDYVGFCHYRRYFNFAEREIKNIGELVSVADVTEVPEILAKKDFLLPAVFDYGGETVAEAYARYHRRQDLDALKKAVGELFPEYLPAFDEVMSSRTMHTCNMFITSAEIFRRYMEWLFAILFRAEKYISIPLDDRYQRRVFGFLAERMLDIFIKHNNFTFAEKKKLELQFAENPAAEYSRESFLPKDRAYILNLLTRLSGKRILFCGDAKTEEKLRITASDAPFFRIVSDDGKLNVGNLAQIMLNTPNVAHILFIPHYGEVAKILVAHGLAENRDFFDGRKFL